MYSYTFNGIEIDMLSLGDADAILVTGYWKSDVWRVLIDGGTADDAKRVREFLRSRNANSLYAVVCTHPHRDHARGLIELVKDRTLSIAYGWMHDMRDHVDADTLRRAAFGNSSRADGVREALETTTELAAAFASRSIAPDEPFSGQIVSCFPGLTVLGPTKRFYELSLKESLGEPIPKFGSLLSAIASSREPAWPPMPHLPTGFLRGALSQPAALSPALPLSFLGGPLTPAPKTTAGFDLSAALSGVLSKSNVEEAPKTQPFNNTSAILGMEYEGRKFLLTADAGSDALDAIPPSWKNLHWMQVPHHGSNGNLSQANIERFCPKFACVSAVGDMSHPDRAIVNGLNKVGAKVFSTHTQGDLWHWVGSVPVRFNYSEAVPLRGSADPIPFAQWFQQATGRL